MILVRALLLLGLFAWGAPASAQPDDGLRFGLTLGGISTVGIVVEAFDRHGSTEVNVGTFGFRDLSLSAVRRHYLGAATARPTVGLGLWSVIGFDVEEGERTAASLVLRAPVGVEWRPADRHALTFDINLNRGLLIRRADPSDDTPVSRRLIPLPGIAYRWWDGG
ncbi:hypothetical protein [Gaopeijia maritima]|uniref:Uncharacterized protein n=1 Tax=Gaopeijia maritima TaxID=3119007 RepID=A0ABU9EAH1_9BACT